MAEWVCVLLYNISLTQPASSRESVFSWIISKLRCWMFHCWFLFLDCGVPLGSIRGPFQIFLFYTHTLPMGHVSFFTEMVPSFISTCIVQGSYSPYCIPHVLCIPSATLDTNISHCMWDSLKFTNYCTQCIGSAFSDMIIDYRCLKTITMNKKVKQKSFCSA